ncbi:MAG TPA: LamG-like jellyroll fold domain-containing protein [Phycisphaerae bacterium]|nr:LamG-like jellyroll fold domain-containing protein [Phycisphaerae bacterium]
MHSRPSIVCRCAALFALVSLQAELSGAETARVFRAGASAVDITPQEFPVGVAGGFFERTAAKAHDRLHARCLALDDGTTRIAIVTVDTCVIPRDLLDQAKQLAHKATGIPMDRMLMSATHTHSAPAIIGLLGKDAEEKHGQLLPEQIAQTVQAAVANLAPARIGWAVVRAPEHTHCRQWIRRPDRIDTDPFGRQSVRAMMHPGYQNPDYLGPSGPVDPDLSFVSVQSCQGRPIALLANYSMHYVGAEPLSADYFGAFADSIARLMGAPDQDPPFVGLMSNGTSGDLHWMDYSQPKPARQQNHADYAAAIARKVFEACRKVEYHDWVPLVMREKTLTLRIRPISDEDLAWARATSDTFKDRSPQTLPEVYAREQVLMSQMPSTRELILQALNIGGLGIVAIPCEVFGITGLKIKAGSPLKPTFTIELANGYDGYIPPPEQHPLGGYTTWRARSSCLEVEAEPKIVAAVIELLEEVSGKPRRVLTGEDYPLGGYPQAVLDSKPIAYWRLNEFSGRQAIDASGNGNHGSYEPGVAFYLEGPAPSAHRDETRINRAPHLAGGRIRANIAGLADKYTVEMWFYNCLPIDARPVTGYLFSRGSEGGAATPGDCLGIGGKDTGAGTLLLGTGDTLEEARHGRTVIQPKSWNHVAMVREGESIAVYLNGNPTAEIAGRARILFAPDAKDIIIGGCSDRISTFEGKIDEVAIYDRALSADDVAKHYARANDLSDAGRR